MYVGTAPLLGIPVLKAYLKEQGVICESVDLNIRFLYWLWEEGMYLEEVSREAIQAFNQFQEKTSVQSQEIPAFVEVINNLSLIPPYLLRKHLKTGFLEGASYEKDPDSWSGNMLSTSFVLHRLEGMFSRKSPESSRDLPRENMRLLNSFNRFLSSEEIRSILVEASKADVVGFSVFDMNTQFIPAITVANEIRRLNPDAFIILGGPGFSGITERKKIEVVSSFDCIDVFGLYGGENFCLQLFDALEGGRDIKDVPNLLYCKGKARKMIQTPLRNLLHPDELPTPEFDDDDLHLYSRAAKQWYPGIRLPVFVSRGCYWGKCAFCSDPMVQPPDQPRYIHRSVEKVLHDVKTLQDRHHTSYFYLISPALAPKWIKKFSGQVVEKGISSNFWGYLRAGNPKIMDRKFFILLKQAGFDYISCGVESTCDRVLEAIDKGHTSEDVKYTIRGLSSAGVHTRFNLIADLPPITPEESAVNKKFLKENISFVNDLAVFKCNVIDGTPMATNPEKFNLKLLLNKDGSLKFIKKYTFLAYENPFYDSPKAQRIFNWYMWVARNLQFHRLTKELRERIAAAGFSWEDSFIMFRPFKVIKSQFSIRAKGKREEIYLMFLEDVYKFVEIPGTFSELITLFREAVQEPVKYGKFLETFSRGFHALQYRTAAGLLPTNTTWMRTLVKFIYEGFVQDIYSEPCLYFHDSETVDNKNNPASPATDINLKMGFREEKGLPFAFFSTPYASVAQSKLT